MLSNLDGNQHPFCYAQVLGIFHANVIYVGPGSKDFWPPRIDFLWVRWLELLHDRRAALGWDECSLDGVRYLPMANEDAFGFVDPALVLRACHVIPSFIDGQLHPDGVHQELSHLLNYT